MKRATIVVLAAGACFGAAACGAGENPTHSASAMAAAPSFDLEGVWAGGKVNLTFYHALHLPGSTVRVDDRVIVEDGVLKL
jgi:ABC-type glycerol-3-phosphate transport system substrate-binding protein